MALYVVVIARFMRAIHSLRQKVDCPDKPGNDEFC
jgi:hypothetical protein